MRSGCRSRRDEHMTFSAVARSLILQRLWPVNRKHGALLDRRERLGIPMKRSAFSLPAHFGCDAGSERDVDDREEAVKEQMRDHIKQSIKQGRSLIGPTITDGSRRKWVRSWRRA
jgi:hypothetical protein